MHDELLARGQFFSWGCEEGHTWARLQKFGRETREAARRPESGLPGVEVSLARSTHAVGRCIVSSLSCVCDEAVI